MNKGLLFGGVLFLTSLLFPTAHAALIAGTAYDGLTLDPLQNVVVTLSTDPIQTKVSKDGTYFFNAPAGTYTLNATYSEEGVPVLEATQSVVIAQEGTFTLDLVLLPDISTPVEDEGTPLTGNVTGAENTTQNALPWWIIGGLVVGGVVLGAYTLHQRTTMTREKIVPLGETHGLGATAENMTQGEVSLDQYATEILDHLRRGGNRLTQKDLREMVNIGEAKVSLVVSELESYQMLKKIKRGRGNILILTDKGREQLEKDSTKKTEHARETREEDVEEELVSSSDESTNPTPDVRPYP